MHRDRDPVGWLAYLARILTRFANEEWNGVLFPKLFSNSIQPTILTDRELVTVEELERLLRYFGKILHWPLTVYQ